MTAPDVAEATGVQWRGGWITSGDDGPVAPLLRREFHAPAGTTRAVLHVAGLGLHRTTLDGRPVSDARLESGITDYARRITYSTYPVELGPGVGVLGVELGRGFHSMTTPNVWGWEEAPWRGPRTALVQLELLGADGGVLGSVVSDETWRWAPGGTRFDSLYEGETFDADLEPHGWDEAGFDDSGWSPVQMAEAPAGALVPQRHEPVRIVGSYPPVRWNGGDGRPWVADFGHQRSGWVQVTPTGVPTGRRLTLRLGERADDAGVILENPHVHSTRLDVHELVVGEDRQAWEPRFTWTGFRYAQVEGIDHPDQVELLARHAHNDVATTSTFTCSDPVLTWIDTAMRATVVNNLHHLPTDTPVYEKNGWLGDAHVALPAMLHQLDLRRLLVKWLDDLVDGQTVEGQLPVIAPTPGWGYIEAPEWTTVYPYLLDQLDRWYGLGELLDAHREPLLRYLRRELTRIDEDGLVEGVLGDYLAPGTDGTPAHDDLRMAASCYLVRGLRAGAALLERHGHEPGEVHGLHAAADALAASVNRVLLDPDLGWYRSEREPTYRQTTNVLPLAFGLVPPDRVEGVVERLVQDLHDRGDRHDAGCLGLSELFGVLSSHGHGDLAVAVARGRRAPSWGAWEAAGETTMLEMWGPVDRSHDHYFMGAMARWLYEDVVGLRMLEPRWTTFLVDPRARAGLQHAGLRLDTVRGEIEVRWREDDRELELDLRVPPGSTALVRLPDRTETECGPGEWRWVVDRATTPSR